MTPQLEFLIMMLTLLDKLGIRKAIADKIHKYYMVFDNSTMDLFSVKAKPISSERLGITKLSGYPYENADGTPFSLIKDYFGNHRSESTPIIGPFEEVNNNRIKLW